MKLTTIVFTSLTTLILTTLPAKADGGANCGNFETQVQAQYYLQQNFNDPAGLDGNFNGIACEHLTGKHSLVIKEQWNIWRSKLAGMSIKEATIVFNQIPVKTGKNTYLLQSPYNEKENIKLLGNYNKIVRASGTF